MQSSVGRRFLKSNSECGICMLPYDRREALPVLVCPMHHTICKPCLDELDPRPLCPFCRDPIQLTQVVVNHYIYDLLPAQDTPPNIRTQAQAQNLSLGLNPEDLG
jgi:hypothetical protein